MSRIKDMYIKIFIITPFSVHQEGEWISSMRADSSRSQMRRRVKRAQLVVSRSQTDWGITVTDLMQFSVPVARATPLSSECRFLSHYREINEEPWSTKESQWFHLSLICSTYTVDTQGDFITWGGNQCWHGPLLELNGAVTHKRCLSLVI